MMRCAWFLFLALALSPVTAFAPLASITNERATGQLLQASPVTITVDLPPTGSDRTATMKIEPVLSASEFVEIRYAVPFDLSVEPKDNLAVCTKDGPGGERVGDVLRYTSQWTLGLPKGEGLVATAAAFSGMFTTILSTLVCHSVLLFLTGYHL